MSTAQHVRQQVEAVPTRAFISIGEVEGSRRAVECELSRLAGSGEIIRVRRGLYWKGPRTCHGMPLPRPDEVAMVVAGPGAGPARLSAAAHLGLTTQVPAVHTIAVAGRTPTAPAATRFVSRSIERRIRGLTPTEVAVIEVLREGGACWKSRGRPSQRRSSGSQTPESCGPTESPSNSATSTTSQRETAGGRSLKHSHHDRPAASTPR